MSLKKSFFAFGEFFFSKKNPGSDFEGSLNLHPSRRLRKTNILLLTNLIFFADSFEIWLDLSKIDAGNLCPVQFREIESENGFPGTKQKTTTF